MDFLASVLYTVGSDIKINSEATDSGHLNAVRFFSGNRLGRKPVVARGY
jgi:hypothetical protein